MKNLAISVVVSCFSLITKAQLYVSPNSYIYVNDQYVTVTSDVNLNDNTSFVYLRNNSQLLQKTTGSGNNKGTGALSIYQEGTVNNYQYNYWCSPVGSVASSTVNNPFSVTQLGVPNTNMSPTSFGAATVYTNWDGSSSNGVLNISSRWLYKYVSGNAYANWVYLGTGNLDTGLGFSMKGTSGTDTYIPFSGASANNPGSAQRYDFRGKPNDGTIANAVSAGNYTLIGNPYPSTIDLDLFLNDAGNAAVLDGNIYYWEQVVKNSHFLAQYEGGYGIYNAGTGYTRADFWSYKSDGTQNADLPAQGTIFQRRFSPIGQGFKIKGTAAGNATMKNSFRVYVKEGAAYGSEFARTAKPVTTDNFARFDNSGDYYPEIPNVMGIDYTKEKKGFAPQIEFYVQFNQGGISPMKLAFDEKATDGYDYGFDAESISKSNNARVYFLSDPSGKEYVINAVKFSIDKKVPFGFSCKAQTKFKMRLMQTLWGFDENQAVFVHDKQSDVYYDVKKADFEVELPAGVYNNRYEITFTDAKLSNPNNDLTSVLDVYANNGSKMLTIKNGQLLDLKDCKMFDVAGKLILSKNNLGNNILMEYPVANLPKGVYVVRVTVADGRELVKKVAIE